MYLVISLLVLRAGYGIWFYQFLIIAYLFTLLMVHQRYFRELERKQPLEKKENNYALSQSMRQLFKGQGHFLWVRDVSKAFETWGDICKFKLILFILGTKKCADYFVFHDCKILMLDCGQINAFMENFGIKHTGFFICFITLFMFKLSNFPESPGLIGFLQMMFTVTSGVLVKHLYICFTWKMYHLISRQEFAFRSWNSFWIHLNGSFFLTT